MKRSTPIATDAARWRRGLPEVASSNPVVRVRETLGYLTTPELDDVLAAVRVELELRRRAAADMVGDALELAARGRGGQ